MSVPIQNTVFTYTANGATTSFSYECYVIAAGDISVYLNDVLQTSGYVVNGVGNVSGGDVVFSAPPAAGTKVRIERDVDIKRDTQYQVLGDFRSPTVNADFDRLWMVLQRVGYFLGLGGVLSRVLRLGDGDVNGQGAYRANQNRIRDLGDPLYPQDAVNQRSMYAYVEKAIAGVVGGFGWFIQLGAGAILRTFQDKMREMVSALDFGADRSGASSALQAIQRAVDSVTDGVVLIPPGSYLMNGDLVIALKANGATSGPKGGFRIEATGARFLGTGRIIVDGCKRVQINGLDAPDHDLVWRGQWWGKYSNFRFRRLVMGDAPGSDFDANYWSDFDTCVLQTIVVDAAAPANCNALTWSNCSFRGSANQGFASSADYAIELNGNQNTQSWTFKNCDMSYHNLGIYKIGDGNADGQVELHWQDSYFDTLYPLPTTRAKTRITVDVAHSANNFPNSALVAAVTRGGHDTFRWDRSAGWARFSAMNFIPNGDLRVGLTSYVGAGNGPVQSTGGASISETTGGLHGRALDINQPATSGTTFLRSLPLPFTGRYSASMVLENVGASAIQLTVAFNGLNTSLALAPGETKYWNLTSGADLSPGSTPSISLSSANGQPFHVKLHCCAVTFGESGMPLTPSSPMKEMIGRVTNFNPPSLAAGARATTIVPVPGVSFGDTLDTPGFGIDTQGVFLRARVHSPNYVEVEFHNPTAGTVDLAAADLVVRVARPSYL